MAKLLIVAATGPGDPTRASIPFHVATNGAGPAEVECGIALAGDATELIKAGVADATKGVGIPPLRDLIDGCVAKGFTFYI
jgi:predicted peroxiredoxin